MRLLKEAKKFGGPLNEQITYHDLLTILAELTGKLPLEIGKKIPGLRSLIDSHNIGSGIATAKNLHSKVSGEVYIAIPTWFFFFSIYSGGDPTKIEGNIRTSLLILHDFIHAGFPIGRAVTLRDIDGLPFDDELKEGIREFVSRDGRILFKGSDTVNGLFVDFKSAFTEVQRGMAVGGNFDRATKAIK